MIEQDLHDWLIGHGPTAAIVADRVYPEKLPQLASYPAVTFLQISGGIPLNLTGPDGFRVDSFQMDCWSTTSQLEAKRLAETITQPVAMGGLHGYRGQMGMSHVQKAAVAPGSIRSEYSPPAHADDLGVFRISFDLVLIYDL